LFNIDESTGAVSFKSPPSTTAPTDAGADNVYNFNAVATDLAGNISSQAVAITVVNAPTLSSSLDDVTNFEVTSNIVLTATENVLAVAGKFIRIVNDGGEGFRGENIVNTQVIEVTSDMVKISGSTITIDPQFDLDFNNNYRIEIDAGAFLGVGSGLASVKESTGINFDAVVANDLASTGIATNDFYIVVNNFGVGDLIYIDNHGDNNVQRQGLFNANLIIDLGAAPTQFITAASGTNTGNNGGQFDITLAGMTDSFADTIALQTLLNVSYQPILYG